MIDLVSESDSMKLIDYIDLDSSSGEGSSSGEVLTLEARGGVLGWYTANTLQGHRQSTHHIPTWALELHS